MFTSKIERYVCNVAKYLRMNKLLMQCCVCVCVCVCVVCVGVCCVCCVCVCGWCGCVGIVPTQSFAAEKDMKEGLLVPDNTSSSSGFAGGDGEGVEEEQLRADFIVKNYSRALDNYRKVGVAGIMLAVCIP